MTFAAFEASQETSQPVEFFTIDVGSISYHYTSAEAAITHSGTPYTPLAISRNKIDYSQESRSNIMEVRVPSSTPFVRLFLSTIPGQISRLTVSRFQRLDSATPQMIILFKGDVQSVTFEEQDKVASIAVVPEGSGLSCEMPRYKYMSACNHVLGDERCKVDENAFKFVGVVTAVSGNVITVSGAGAFTPGYFAAGRVETPGSLDRRLVLGHSGSLLTLLLPFGISPLGATVTCFAGCGHDPDSCFTIFANTVNYGGFAFVPKRNPYATGL